MSYNGPEYPQGPQQPQYPGAPQGGSYPGQPDPYGQQGGQPDPYGQQGGQPDPYGQYPGAQPYPGGAQPYGDPAAGGYGDPSGYGAGWNQPPASPKTGLSITALVLGALALLSCFLWFVSAPLGIAGLVVGILALLGVKKGTQGGKGLALTGTILSGVGLIATTVITLIVLVWANNVVDDINTSLSPSTTPSATASDSPSPSDEPSDKPSASAAPGDFTVQDVNETWTDPATQDVLTVSQFVVGGPAPDDDSSILVGVNMTMKHGGVYYGTDMYAADFEPQASKGWTSGAWISTLDADEATDVIAAYGLEGPALDPYASPRDDSDLSGWVFYEVPAKASGDWTLTWTRDAFSDDSDQTFDAETMNIPLGSS